MSKILIIEDSQHLAAFLRDVLVREGHYVFTAAGQEEGLVLFQQQKPDLTLLSVHVRADTAWDTARAIRKADPWSSVLVMASVHLESAEAAATELGCVGFISKELGLEAFMHGVKQAVMNILPPQSPPKAKSKGRILVADDDEAVRAVLERFLKMKGYTVITAADGEEAIAQIKRERPHLLLLDIDMPKLNGLEVLKLVREMDKTLAVMMVTANNDLETAEWAIKKGASDYIVKPLNFQYLENVVMTKLIMMTS